MNDISAIIVGVLLIGLLVVFLMRGGRKYEKRDFDFTEGNAWVGQQQQLGGAVVTRTYKGSMAEATAAYQQDAIKMSAAGYVPASQLYQPGSYGCGAFLVALILCFVLVGILIFVYMLIVKPAGTLVVTYVRQA